MKKTYVSPESCAYSITTPHLLAGSNNTKNTITLGGNTIRTTVGDDLPWNSGVKKRVDNPLDSLLWK